MNRIPLLLSILLTGPACATTHRAFGPTEHVEGQTIEGYEEAFYDLTDDGKRVGVVKVWSRGAFRRKDAGIEVTDLHVGFDVEALAERDITLDVSRVALDSVWLKEGTLEDISGPSSEGSPITASGTTGSIELTFTLPSDVRVTDVGAFRVHWYAKADGREFSEFTPFVQQRAQRAYVPVFAYYHPYCVPGAPCFASSFYVGRPVVIVRHYPRRIGVRAVPRRRPRR